MNNENFIKLFNNRKTQFWTANNLIFKIYNKMLIPECPIYINSTLTKDKAIHLLKKSNTILIRTMSDFDCGEDKSEWYALICQEFTHMDKMSSKYRYEINKGLKNCIIKKISSEELARNGYDCYYSALKKYKNPNIDIMTKTEFENSTMQSAGFDDIYHIWGAYINDNIIAYSTVYIYEKESSYTVFKVNPDYQKLFPMYALIYKMNEYYLEEQKFQYIKAGFRSLLHDTSVQDFLIKKFGFKKVYMKLHIQYSPLIGIFMKLAFPFRKFIAKFDARFNALFELERIHRKSKA